MEQLNYIFLSFLRIAYSRFHSTLQMECLCHANFLHKSDEQFNCQLQQMSLNTTWKKKYYINTHVQLKVNASVGLGNRFVWHK